MRRLPKKLKKDAILEALVDVRFESSEVEDILIGRLSDTPKWKSFERRVNPVKEVPPTIRRQQVGFKYLPIVELWSPDKRIAVKLGGNVASLHLMAPYPGWAEFRRHITTLIGAMRKAIPTCDVRRLGLRYINALTNPDHRISSMGALNLQLTVGGVAPAGPILVQARKPVESLEGNSAVVVRVASPEFVEGVMPPQTVAIVDVDVYTGTNYSRPLDRGVTAWIDKAHRVEKTEFFGLIPDAALAELVEE